MRGDVYLVLLKNKYPGSFRDLDAARPLGVLVYPDGGRYTAEWEEGRAVSGHFSFDDGLPYQVHNWSYLAPNDRRFVEEVRQGFDAQRATQRTSPKVPIGTFDTGTYLRYLPLTTPFVINTMALRR